MIKDKISGTVISDNAVNSKKKYVTENDILETVTNYSEMPDNGIIDVHNAIKSILKGVRWSYNDKNSKKIFNTVKANTGQYEFVVTGDSNPMSEIAFPAALINFINIRWTSQQNTLNEGTAELRIQILMNTLNNMDDDKETEMYYVAQRVIQTIQEEKSNYDCLTKKCKLTFMDTATSYHSGLQSCWLTFDLEFTEINVWSQRRRIQRYIVVPPFTNHSDQKDPNMNLMHHTNSNHKKAYDEVSKYNTLTEEDS